MQGLSILFVFWIAVFLGVGANENCSYYGGSSCVFSTFLWLGSLIIWIIALCGARRAANR